MVLKLWFELLVELTLLIYFISELWRSYKMVRVPLWFSAFSITLNLNLHSVTLTYFLGEFHLQLFVDTFAPKLYHSVAQMVICFPVTLDN